LLSSGWTSESILEERKEQHKKSKKSNAELEQSHINTSPKQPCHPAHYVVSRITTSCIPGQEEAKKASEKPATLR
jgi:hypothetical protein